MKRWVIGVAFILTAGGQGLASDLPPPAAPAPPRAPAAYIPPASPVYNWGGLYFGFNAGYAFGTSNWVDANNPAGQTGNFSTTGFVGGATLGANFQTDAFVYGAEFHFNGSLNDGKNSSAFCGNVGFGSGAQCETKNSWFSTLRARLGYAADRVLFYGTGGGASADVSSGINDSLQRSTQAGYVEAAFSENLTGRIEYLYMRLEDGGCSNAANCGLDAAGVAADDTVKFSTSMIRFGLDYKFH